VKKNHVRQFSIISFLWLTVQFTDKHECHFSISFPSVPNSSFRFPFQLPALATFCALSLPNFIGLAASPIQLVAPQEQLSVSERSRAPSFCYAENCAYRVEEVVELHRSLFAARNSFG